MEAGKTKNILKSERPLRLEYLLLASLVALLILLLFSAEKQFRVLGLFETQHDSYGNFYEGLHQIRGFLWWITHAVILGCIFLITRSGVVSRRDGIALAIYLMLGSILIIGKSLPFSIVLLLKLLDSIPLILLGSGCLVLISLLVYQRYNPYALKSNLLKWLSLGLLSVTVFYSLTTFLEYPRVARSPIDSLVIGQQTYFVTNYSQVFECNLLGMNCDMIWKPTSQGADFSRATFELNNVDGEPVLFIQGITSSWFYEYQGPDDERIVLTDEKAP